MMERVGCIAKGCPRECGSWEGSVAVSRDACEEMFLRLRPSKEGDVEVSICGSASVAECLEAMNV